MMTMYYIVYHCITISITHNRDSYQPTSIRFGSQMWFVMDNPSVFRGFSSQPRLIKFGTSFSQPKWVA